MRAEVFRVSPEARQCSQGSHIEALPLNPWAGPAERSTTVLASLWHLGSMESTVNMKNINHFSLPLFN